MMETEAEVNNGEWAEKRNNTSGPGKLLSRFLRDVSEQNY
jgi:hypothetical protein